MAVKLIYQTFVKLLSWMALRARSDTANEIEILVLRHQLAVLQRREPRPRINWTVPSRKATASDHAGLARDDDAEGRPSGRRWSDKVTPFSAPTGP